MPVIDALGARKTRGWGRNRPDSGDSGPVYAPEAQVVAFARLRRAGGAGDARERAGDVPACDSGADTRAS